MTFVITTAGFDKNSICWEQHDYAVKVLEGVIDDPEFLPVIYSAPLVYPAPVFYRAPVVYPAPLIYPGTVIVRPKIFFRGQPLRNAVRAVLP